MVFKLPVCAGQSRSHNLGSIGSDSTQGCRRGTRGSATAERLDLNRTAAYRDCTSLVATGLLERSTEGGYAPGGLLLQLGAFAIGDGATEIPNVARSNSPDSWRAFTITPVPRRAGGSLAGPGAGGELPGRHPEAVDGRSR